MKRTVKTVNPSAPDGPLCTIEAEITNGIGIHLVGLADTCVKETLLRTYTALQVNGYRMTGKKIVFNLVQTDALRNATGYDLPLALAYIAASGQEEFPDLERWLAAGELALDGGVRDTDGCELAVAAAKDGGFEGCIIPMEHAGRIPYGIDTQVPVYAVSSLTDACEILKGNEQKRAELRLDAVQDLIQNTQKHSL